MKSQITRTIRGRSPRGAIDRASSMTAMTSAAKTSAVAGLRTLPTASAKSGKARYMPQRALIAQVGMMTDGTPSQAWMSRKFATMTRGWRRPLCQGPPGSAMKMVAA